MLRSAPCRVSPVIWLVGFVVAIATIVHLTTNVVGSSARRAKSGLLSLAGSHSAIPLGAGAQEMLDQSMDWMDRFYDADAGYLGALSASGPRTHDTRASIWYACGLLARDKKGDVEEADKIINNIIDGQYVDDPSKEWYGVYQRKPEEPDVGSSHYAGIIYGSWDPNWRGFISCAMIVALEEFSDRLTNATQEAMIESIRISTVGDTYRFGNIGIGKDNLYPAYSNPAIMRAFASGWTGRKVNDENMTRAGEDYGKGIIDLFRYFDTLSEYNSPTYTGVSLFGLVCWAKYLPKESVMADRAPHMVGKIWESVAQMWNPNLRNIAGPWDRVYGYDMNNYLSIMALWMWPHLGKNEVGLTDNPEIMHHSADYAFAPVLAILDEFSTSMIPKGVINSMKTIEGDRLYETSAWSPPYDNVWRNYTTWMDEKMAIGGMSFNQVQQGGAGGNLEAFMPMIAHWDTGDEVGWIALITGEFAMTTHVEPGKITMTYPRGEPHALFSFAVSTFKNTRTITAWHDLPGINVKLSSPNVALLDYDVKYGGKHGGKEGVSMGFERWQFVHHMRPDYVGKPELTIEFEIERNVTEVGAGTIIQGNDDDDELADGIEGPGNGFGDGQIA